MRPKYLRSKLVTVFQIKHWQNFKTTNESESVLTKAVGTIYLNFCRQKHEREILTLKLDTVG